MVILGTVTVGGTPRTSVEKYWNGDVPWMASGDVNLKRITDVPTRISELGLRHSNATTRFSLTSQSDCNRDQETKFLSTPAIAFRWFALSWSFTSSPNSVRICRRFLRRSTRPSFANLAVSHPGVQDQPKRLRSRDTLISIPSRPTTGWRSKRISANGGLRICGSAIGEPFSRLFARTKEIWRSGSEKNSMPVALVRCLLLEDLGL